VCTQAEKAVQSDAPQGKFPNKFGTRETCWKKRATHNELDVTWLREPKIHWNLGKQLHQMVKTDGTKKDAKHEDRKDGKHTGIYD